MYIRISPLAAWPTMPDAPIETIRPTSTDSPLNASLPEPGMYGYAIASAKIQTPIDRQPPGRPRRVGVEPADLDAPRLDAVEEVAAARR